MTFTKTMTRAALAAGVAFAAVAPAYATPIIDGQSGVVFSAFNIATQGTLLASLSGIGTADTFTGTYTTAVYRNTSGTLDFYYQFSDTGGDPVERLTASNFTGFTTDAQVYSGATGSFLTASNPGPAALASRLSGIVGVAFDISNPVKPGETSATYIFRTNATDYKPGTYSAQDGTVAPLKGFAPTAVPEPATWAMMIVGFGIAGAALRRRKTTTSVSFA